MKVYKYSGNLDKLLHQNRGEITDIQEGCLLDSYLIDTKRGYIALIETYVNCWTSDYTLYFSEDASEIDAIWSERIYAN